MINKKLLDNHFIIIFFLDNFVALSTTPSVSRFETVKNEDPKNGLRINAPRIGKDNGCLRLRVKEGARKALRLWAGGTFDVCDCLVLISHMCPYLSLSS